MKKIMVKILTVLVALSILTSSLPLVILADEISSDEAAREQLSSPGYIEVSDGYVKIQVSEDNGGFYIGLVEGDKLTKADNNKHLIYPDSDYDTSFTTFRVKQDGKTRDFIFGGDYSHLGLATSEVNVEKTADNAISAVWSVGGIIFTQTIAFMDTNSSMHGMAYITYGVQNKSGTPIEDIDARVMMDTALGVQDYAIYMTAKENGSFDMVTKEKTVSGADYNNFFYLYDNRTAPTVVAYTVNAQVGGRNVVPEKVTFAHWNNLAATEFDYEPSITEPLDFTSVYNADYMTADSAVALYYDMGAVAVDGSGSAVGLYYGVYSNHTVGDSDVGLNIINSDVIELNEEKTEYLDANGDRNGNFSMDVRLQNVSDKEIPSLALAIMPGEFMYPYGKDGAVVGSDPQNPYYVEVTELMPGEIRDIRIDFEIDVSNITDYRRVRLSVYNSSHGVSFTDSNLILTKDSYVFCPGSTSAELGFTGMVPQMTGESGRRFVYITGTNFSLLRDKSRYRVVLRPLSGGDDVVIDSSRLVVNPELNTATVVIDEKLNLGTWQVIIDWTDAALTDIISDSLRLDVLSAEELDKAAISAAVSTSVYIVRHGNGTSEPYHYELTEGSEYAQNDPRVMLTLSGNFNTLSSPQKGLYKAEAVTLSKGEVINISGCLDVKDGRVTVTVEYDEGGKQTAINVDVDGKVYTTGANTKVWDGVCAITSFEEGKLLSLTEYSSDGEREEVDGDNITLLWPGAASGAQTLVGLLLEMRYCEFGIMDTPSGGRRVVAFSAQLSPSFLIPNGSQYEAARSPREEEEQRIVYANYTANDLRRVDNRYEQSDKQWRQNQTGTLNMYVDDILFGGYFIGFNTTVEVGIPAIVDGMPYIEGTLSLKIINHEWEFMVSGTADLNVFEMEATLALKSYNGIPVLDTFSFFVGGFFPGVMVDPFGVFWIRGAGGGVENLYETFFGRDTIPPLTLTLCGEFAIFSVLSAKANLSVSLRGFEAAFTDISVAGIRIIDYLGGSVYWYPDLSIACRIDVSIFDAIVGGGAITARKDFFEAYIYAGVQIPDDIWLIGGLEIGSAELGVSTEKIWGKVKVIGIGVGVTYFWGGKGVDVDLLSATVKGGRNLAKVGTDENGNTLYVETTNNIRLVYTTKKAGDPVLLSAGSPTSSDGMRAHSFILSTTAAEDGVITLTYKAKNELDAYDIKDTVAVSIGGEEYKLKWLDRSLPADDFVNEGANAVVKFDEELGEATVSISLTDPENQIGKEFTVTVDVASELSVYGVERIPDLESALLGDGKVTVFGTNAKYFSSINLYARDAENNVYQVGSADLGTAVTGADGIDSVDIDVVYPESLPGGTYTLEVVGCLKDENGNEISNPIVELEGEVVFTNANQPMPLRNASVALGGNYTLSLSVTPAAADFDGYSVDIFELTEDGYKKTSFTNLQIALGENKAEAGKSVTLTVGGRILNTDENGNGFYTGLEEGKVYKVSVSTYKTLDSGAVVESAAITTEKIEMVKPTVTKPELSIDGKVSIAAGISGISVDTVKTSSPTVKITGVGEIRSGYYILNENSPEVWDGKDVGFVDLEDGMYTLTVGGINQTGDSFSAVYQFSVDTAAPSLLITSHEGGGFYTTDRVTVTGTAEAGAKISASIDGGEAVTVYAANDSSFSLSLILDLDSAYQDVRIVCEDALGNQSPQYGFTLTNLLLGETDLELVCLIDGDEVTHIAADGKPVKLALALKAGGRYVNINENSASAARISWNSNFISGSGSISGNGELLADVGSVGIVSASLDNLSATVEVIPTSLLTLDAELVLPERGYTYDGTAKEPEVKVPSESGLVFGTDYTVSYVNNVNAGTASAIITAVSGGNCSGSLVLYFEITPLDVAYLEIIPKREGEAVSVTVKDGEKELVLDTDYSFTVEEAEDKLSGKITVVGIGNYTGTKILNYTVDGEGNIIGPDDGGFDPDASTDPDAPTAPDDKPDGDEPDGDAPNEDGPDGSSEGGAGWFSKNAGWFIPVITTALGAVSVLTYLCIVKKQELSALIRKLLKKKNGEKDDESDPDDDEKFNDFYIKAEPVEESEIIEITAEESEAIEPAEEIANAAEPICEPLTEKIPEALDEEQRDSE